MRSACGAFVVVADDATANYWNQADLATGPILSVLVDHQTTEKRADGGQFDSPGMDDSSLIVSLATSTLSITYYRLRGRQVARGEPSGGEVEAREDQQSGDVTIGSLVTHYASLTLVQLLTPGVAVGIPR